MVHVFFIGAEALISSDSVREISSVSRKLLKISFIVFAA